MSWPCPAMSLRARARWGVVSQCLGLPCHNLPAPDTNIVSRHRAPAARSPRVLPCVSQLPEPYRGALLRCIRTQRSPPPQPRYKVLYRDPPLARPRARALTAVSWRATVRPCAASQALCQDTITCIVTQHWKMGSSPFQLLQPFFSLCFTYWKTTKIYYILFYFPVEPNKFIRIYFIYFYFFFSFTHCKTSEKNLFHTHFFFLCAIHQAHKSHNIYNNSCYTHHSSKCTMDA